MNRKIQVHIDVPAGDLRGVNSKYSETVNRVLTEGSLVGGRYVENFEKSLRNYFEADHALTVASGMDALILGIQALSLPANSRIAVADNGGGYASLAVLSAGHIPVFCDTERVSFLIDLNSVMRLKDISAVVVTHLYGQVVKLDELMLWARTKEIKVVEDCAQAFGAVNANKKAGMFGDVGCFSFYPTKNLGGIGDGGAVITNSHEIAEKILRLRQYGWNSKYDVGIPSGRNSRLDAVNAAVLNEKILDIDQNNQIRRNIYSRYLQADPKSKLFLNRNLDESNVVHLAVGLSENSEQLINFFAEKGIEIGRHYPVADSKQAGLNFRSEIKPNPNAFYFCQNNVTFPMYPHLKSSQIEKVISVISEWVQNES